MNRRYYRPCERFMEDGGIYGRSRSYPWRAYRTRHVFSTCIRVHLREPDYTRRSANAMAYNSQPMHVMFAYEWRRRRVWTPPPQGKEPALPEVYIEEWREAA